jgi:hypothetical protein
MPVRFAAAPGLILKSTEFSRCRYHSKMESDLKSCLEIFCNINLSQEGTAKSTINHFNLLQSIMDMRDAFLSADLKRPTASAIFAGHSIKDFWRNANIDSMRITA